MLIRVFISFYKFFLYVEEYQLRKESVSNNSHVSDKKVDVDSLFCGLRRFFSSSLENEYKLVT